MNGGKGVLIAAGAAFIVGCSVGLMGGILFMRSALPGSHGKYLSGGMRGGYPQHFGSRGPRGPEGARHQERMISHLERELDLTPAQRERIVAQLDAARAGHAAVRESMQVWLERELTPGQHERWKKMEARFERSRRGSGSRGSGSADRP